MTRLLECCAFYVLVLLWASGIVDLTPTLLNSLSSILGLQVPLMILGVALIFLVTESVHD
jgi:hypothetical protein